MDIDLLTVLVFAAVLIDGFYRATLPVR